MGSNASSTSHNYGRAERVGPAVLGQLAQRKIRIIIVIIPTIVMQMICDEGNFHKSLCTKETSSPT